MPLDRQFNMRTIDAMIIRGGSSKGVYMEIDDLPPAGPERDEIVLKVFGSPDERQIDGLGGADKLTSKVALMGQPTREDCDIDYLFGQVNQTLPRIDWRPNCGNLSAGAALYGALLGKGRREGDIAVVNVHQVNTGRQLRTRVPMAGDAPAVEGDFAIGGVPGTGPRLDVDFGDFAGSALGGAVLPTGNARDEFDIPGLGRIEASVVDMANLHIFVRAADVGLDTAASIQALQADSDLVGRLEAIRKVVSHDIGFITGENADEELQVSMNPLIFAVAEPVDYTATNGLKVEAGAHDLFSRSLARFAFSKAYPGSGSAGTAVACGIAGSIAHEACRDAPGPGQEYEVRVGHPGGCLSVRARTDLDNEKGLVVSKAEIGRTARLLMQGKAFIR
jgi:2-methylaconitate cis-trans-isomerase PrpF